MPRPVAEWCPDRCPQILRGPFPGGAAHGRVRAPTQGGWAPGDRGHGGALMNEMAIRLRDEEQGMSTAEYAVGTVAVAGLGGLLIKLLSSEQFANLLWQVLSRAFSFLFT